MKNVVILQKDEDGRIHCSQITKEGVEYAMNPDIVAEKNVQYWEEGGFIELDELEEILDKEI